MVRQRQVVLHNKAQKAPLQQVLQSSHDGPLAQSRPVHHTKQAPAAYIKRRHQIIAAIITII